MKLSKRIISILIISVMIICVGSLFFACLPVTQTEEGATTKGTETHEPTGFAKIFASYGTYIWLAILVVAVYFLLIRPRRARSKKAQELMSRKEIKCSKCGRIIGQSPTTIAEDIRRGGGVLIGGNSLDIPMYKCTICPSCGSAFCLSCQRPTSDPCPKCGKSNLSPGFADLVQKYYKF